MENPISVGDLVVVVRGHCSLDQQEIGLIFVVKEVWHRGYRCSCGENTYAGHDFGPGDDRVFEPGWLKRIPDFPELKDERHGEEITA